METRNTKIAFATDDGSTISAHFGRALYYEVVTIRDGRVEQRERVSKAGHHSPLAHNGSPHGHDDPQQQTHTHDAMITPVTDCAFIIAGGMGMGAHQYLSAAGVQPLTTDIKSIDEALTQFVAGTLSDDPRRVHQHGGHHHP